MALKGVKVIELAGLAPAPFCGMVLRDHGASVMRLDKPNTPRNMDALSRGKRSLILDLKKPKATQVLSRICKNVDVLLDPYRPGVMEKCHLGPTDLMKANPKLIYARLTGFGQDGPYSKMAGHDINYIAISGVLSALGRSDDKPYHPINLLGDFAGGGLMCALGICMALLERSNSGKGQVIDANMVEGSAYVSTWLWSSRDPDYNFALWGSGRGNNLLDGGAPFYQTYKTSDEEYVAVGALEPQFYKALLKGLELDEDKYSQFSNWSKLKQKFTKLFATKTRDQWSKIFDFTDACVTPVMPLDKAFQHPHNAYNKSFIFDGKKYFPMPAPRLSRTPAEFCFKEPIPGQHSVEILTENGFDEKEINSLLEENVVQYATASSL